MLTIQDFLKECKEHIVRITHKADPSIDPKTLFLSVDGQTKYDPDVVGRILQATDPTNRQKLGILLACYYYAQEESKKAVPNFDYIFREVKSIFKDANQVMKIHTGTGLNFGSPASASFLEKYGFFKAHKPLPPTKKQTAEQAAMEMEIIMRAIMGDRAYDDPRSQFPGRRTTYFKKS